jgi:lysophospholipase L1-like esterase
MAGPSPPSTARRLLLRVTLIPIAVLVLLGLAAELAASFTKSGNAAFFIADADLIIIRKPDMHGFTMGNGGWVPCHINRQGLRGDDLPEPRPASERRILCVGDSFTFGSGVEDDEAWPQQLQALLGPPQVSGVRVLNGGANGWDTRWQRRYLQARALDGLSPDVVVLGWNWNDLNVDPTKEAGPDYAKHFLEGGSTWLAPFGRRQVLRESHLYRWLHSRVAGGAVRPPDESMQSGLVEYRRMMTVVGIDPERAIAGARKRRFGDKLPDGAFWTSTDTPTWKLVRVEMAAIRDACAARGTAFGVAIFPEPSWNGPGPFPGTERLVALLDALGIPSVDVQAPFLAPFIQGMPPQRRADLWQRYDLVHPTPEGHRIMAEHVRRMLLEHELLPLASR